LAGGGWSYFSRKFTARVLDIGYIIQVVLWSNNNIVWKRFVEN